MGPSSGNRKLHQLSTVISRSPKRNEFPPAIRYVNEERSNHATEDYRWKCRLDSVFAARKHRRSLQRTSKNGRPRCVARHANAKEIIFGEVPAKVNPDRKPERSRRHVRKCEHEAGLDDDRRRSKERCMRIEPMNRTEGERRHRHADPRSASTLNRAEEQAAKCHFFPNGRSEREDDRTEKTRGEIEGLEPVVTAEREQPDQQSKESASDQCAQWKKPQSPSREFASVALLDQPNVGDETGCRNGAFQKEDDDPRHVRIEQELRREAERPNDDEGNQSAEEREEP